MSTSRLVLDFFQAGYRDMVAEVRTLESRGQWTQEKRARWTQQAISTHLHFKHSFPFIKEGVSYYAGRVAALKSRRTAHVSANRSVLLPTTGMIVFRFLPLPADHCGECFASGDEALSTLSFPGDVQPFPALSLCACCKQERVRAETVYTTPDDWDWDEDEDLAACADGAKLVVRKRSFPCVEQAVVPFACVIGFGLFDLLTGIQATMILLQIFLVCQMAISSEDVHYALVAMSRLFDTQE